MKVIRIEIVQGGGAMRVSLSVPEVKEGITTEPSARVYIPSLAERRRPPIDTGVVRGAPSRDVTRK